MKVYARAPTQTRGNVFALNRPLIHDMVGNGWVEGGPMKSAIVERCSSENTTADYCFVALLHDVIVLFRNVALPLSYYRCSTIWWMLNILFVVFNNPHEPYHTYTKINRT